MIDLELHVGSIFDLGNGRASIRPWREGQLLAQRLPNGAGILFIHIANHQALDIHLAKVLITPGSQRWERELFELGHHGVCRPAGL